MCWMLGRMTITAVTGPASSGDRLTPVAALVDREYAGVQHVRGLLVGGELVADDALVQHRQPRLAEAVRVGRDRPPGRLRADQSTIHIPGIVDER